MAVLVNLMGAPCSGKSTIRADVFRILKQKGINAEEVTEHAKKLTWAGRHKEITSQPFLAGKQLRDMELLMNQVDVIVTDSPLILCAFYNRLYCPGKYPPAFERFVIDQFKAMGGLNIYLHRVGTYQAAGRNQDEAEADEIGVKLQELMEEIGCEPLTMDGDEHAGPAIVAQIEHILRVQKANESWPFSAMS
jgi:hypothetical protein